MQIGCCGIADQADTIRRMGYPEDQEEIKNVCGGIYGERRPLFS